ncbi:MAG TPA: 4-hydroxyproline epimerase [Bryobacteraceae bacterium]|nr:4-hydroxyproline epimerase [Bryobacteraceae bacterium]
MTATARRVDVIDSHTAGEPTRIVIAGAPDLGSGSMADRLARFRETYDEFRSAVVNEPRGSDVLVGALLCEPADPGAAAGVIFFNNVGYLGMCGHGTIGLIVTLAHMGRIEPGTHRVETPVGTVSATLHESGEVTVENVPSYRLASGVPVRVAGYGVFTGDVAWGGNSFYLVAEHGQAIRFENIETLTDCTWKIRQALAASGVTGRDGQEIDHIELFGPPELADADSKNFVLCPGKAYDRSPCGTGTSAKLACLAADGRLAEGKPWRQESIVGSMFTGSYRRLANGCVLPSITGSAWVNSEATLILNPDDPFCMGIRR